MTIRYIAPTIAVLALLSSPAFAWDCNYWSQSTNPKGECYKPVQKPVKATGGNARSRSSSKSKATANAAATNYTSVATESTATASNAGVTTEFTDASSFNEPRQTPPAFSGYVEPTTSCANARNGGASSPIAGISFGFSTKDKECDLRETAREFYEMGQQELAVRLLCKSEAAKKLEDCKFTAPAPTQVSEYSPGERERRMRSRGFPDPGK